MNEVVCKGCGSCNAICPSGAISIKHFRDKQIYAQIEAMKFSPPMASEWNKEKSENKIEGNG